MLLHPSRTNCSILKRKVAHEKVKVTEIHWWPLKKNRNSLEVYHVIMTWHSNSWRTHKRLARNLAVRDSYYEYYQVIQERICTQKEWQIWKISTLVIRPDKMTTKTWIVFMHQPNIKVFHWLKLQNNLLMCCSNLEEILWCRCVALQKFT